MWMGNLMYSYGKPGEAGQQAGGEGGAGAAAAAGADPSSCYLIDFHSAQYLSPATDLAHLLLTSTTREYRQKHWDEVVLHYYNVFNRTLAEFGLVLRHLGTTYNDFLYEVKRALRGQFLCVAFIIPIGRTHFYYLYCSGYRLTLLAVLGRMRVCTVTAHARLLPNQS